MNEQLKEFIRGVGVLVEMWVIVYDRFRQQKYDEKEALIHTKAFMETVIRTNNHTEGAE